MVGKIHDPNLDRHTRPKFHTNFTHLTCQRVDQTSEEECQSFYDMTPAQVVICDTHILGTYYAWIKDRRKNMIDWNIG